VQNVIAQRKASTEEVDDTPAPPPPKPSPLKRFGAPAAAILILVGASLGAYTYFTRPTPVLTAQVQATRVPTKTETAASAAVVVNDTWLRFKTAGKIGKISVSVPSQVKKGDVLMRLVPPPAFAKKVKRATRAHEKASQALQARAADSEKLRQGLKERKSKLAGIIEEIANREEAAESPRTIRALKTTQKVLQININKAQKQLKRASKKEKQAGARQSKAQKKLARLHKRLGRYDLVAPYDGMVMALEEPGTGKVRPRDKVIRLVDLTLVRATFTGDALPTHTLGDELLVGHSEHSFLKGKVSAIPTKKKPHLQVDILDPTTGIGKVDAESIYLFTEFREHTFRVPQPALIKNPAEGFTVLVMRDGKAEEVLVDVLNYHNDDALIQASGGGLRSDEAVIIATEEGLSAAAITPGSSVSIPQEAGTEPEATPAQPAEGSEVREAPSKEAP
jgi:multidrug resistance efflux pump